MIKLGKIDEIIKKIDQADCVDGIAQVVRNYIKFLGFDTYSYQLLKSPEGPRPAFYITGYPAEWDDRYSSKGYVSHDMVSRHAARVIRPFSWLEIGRYNDFTAEQKRIFDEATEFKIKAGATVPIHGPGLARALFSVASDMPHAEFTKLFSQVSHELHLLATYMHERLLALGMIVKPETSLKLTPRELEILTWTARGKSGWDISQILSIGEDTVSEHLSNIYRKLDTSNKTHATAVALIHGLIIP